MARANTILTKPATAHERAKDVMPLRADQYEAFGRDFCQRLRLTFPCDLGTFLAASEAYLQTRLRIHPEDFGESEVFGAVALGDDNEYIISVKFDLPPAKWRTTILHEVVHVVRGHVTATTPHMSTYQPLTPEDREAEDIAIVLDELLDDADQPSLIDRFWARSRGDE